MKAHSHITLQWSKHHRDAGGARDASVHLSPVSRWVAYLVTIPLALVGIVLAAFFFSAFLAVFLIAGSALGIWVWWARRQSVTHEGSDALEGTYRVVSETQIAENTSAGARDENPLRR